ncbi:MAG TPA: KUP/HAK/KT family potassium transporter, partial [Chitinophagaceae bacterium]|nr:KUP/HAK/KT family potassium transporter [Chitinophagaceae bacterium]
MSSHNKVTAAGLLIALGIIYGDIGTSPLYVLNAIISGKTITSELIIGVLSLIIWTLTLQTTIKYVILTLNADNKGEGGIFSLFALVRRRKRWLVIPAMIGGAALLADGMITPPISVTSAIEGLKQVPALSSISQSTIVYIVIAIITLLFFIQQFGTAFIGKFFGPIMTAWFLMLALLGVLHLTDELHVFKAFNPYYGIDLLIKYPSGFYILGGVFLCTTGAEALYSDLGHCGKWNIRYSWIYVKSCLILNYLGQGAWLLKQYNGKKITAGLISGGFNPFYGVMPHWFLYFGIAIATAAAIIASQALISGSFTLISEAMRLNLWPKFRIVYPTEARGQLYIPSINLLLF